MAWKCYFCKIELADDVERCECGSIRPREREIARRPATPSADPTLAQHLVPVPVARRCPGCGGERFRKVKPRARVAFAKDRICLDCQTRYAPPTPVWGSVIFILAGGMLAGLMALALVGRVLMAHPCGIPAMIVQGLLGLMGLLALFHGLRTLFVRPVDASGNRPPGPPPTL